MKSWFERNYHWLLYFKMTPALILIGTFGRRPITIANLIAPSAVNTLTGFLTFLAAPILIFAFLDALYLGLTVYEEKWKIKQLEDKENKSLKHKKYTFNIEENIRALRAKIDNLPANQNSIDFIKGHIFDDAFKYQLQAQNIDEDVFIDHLMRRNNYNRSHKSMAEKYHVLSEFPDINYRQLWMFSQIRLIHALLNRYDASYQEIKKGNDPEAVRTFILSNIFYYRLRAQLHDMGIDENKFLDAILSDQKPAAIVSQFEPGADKSTFNYGNEWLKTDVKLMRMVPHQPISRGFLGLLNRANIPVQTFVNSLQRKTLKQSPHEYSSQDIGHEFRCLTTEKSFAQEHSWIAKNIKLYENLKKVLVFPLRTIGLMLVMESLFPFALSLTAGLITYACIGLAISALVIALERLPDAYVDKLKISRDNDLENIHTAEQVGTIDRLDLRAEKYIPSYLTSKVLYMAPSIHKTPSSNSLDEKDPSPETSYMKRVDSDENKRGLGKDRYD